MLGKRVTQSKTIRVGSLYVGGGLLVVVLQFLGQLQSILEAINLKELPPEMAAWFMAIIGVIGVIGGVQVLLRMVTKEPILPISPPEDKDDANG